MEASASSSARFASALSVPSRTAAPSASEVAASAPSVEPARSPSERVRSWVREPSTSATAAAVSSEPAASVSTLSAMARIVASSPPTADVALARRARSWAARSRFRIDAARRTETWRFSCACSRFTEERRCAPRPATALRNRPTRPARSAPSGALEAKSPSAIWRAESRARESRATGRCARTVTAAPATSPATAEAAMPTSRTTACARGLPNPEAAQAAATDATVPAAKAPPPTARDRVRTRRPGSSCTTPGSLDQPDQRGEEPALRCGAGDGVARRETGGRADRTNGEDLGELLPRVEPDCQDDAPARTPFLREGGLRDVSVEQGDDLPFVGSEDGKVPRVQNPCFRKEAGEGAPEAEDLSRNLLDDGQVGEGRRPGRAIPQRRDPPQGPPARRPTAASSTAARPVETAHAALRRGGAVRPTCRTRRALTSSGSRSIGLASLSAAFLVSTSRRNAEQPAHPSRCATRLAAAATSSSSSQSASMSGSEVSQSIVAAPDRALQRGLTSAADSVFRRLARLAALPPSRRAGSGRASGPRRSSPCAARTKGGPPRGACGRGRDGTSPCREGSRGCRPPRGTRNPGGRRARRRSGNPPGDLRSPGRRLRRASGRAARPRASRPAA